MGKSSGGKAEVVEYTMSIHVAVGHELDAVTEIRVDEKVAWRGNVTTNTAIGINNPNLFGGQRKEGGLVGTVQVLMGREDQVLPAAAAARYRLAPNDCPAHRGVTTLMFHGSGAISTGRLGEWDNVLAGLVNIPGFPPDQPAYSGSGFLWKMNSPVIAQKIEVTGVRAPKGLDPTTAMVGPDANPIHIIYECLVNDEWGMAGAAALIDKAGFEVEATRLRDEGFGISLWWMRQQTIEAFVTEILDHIQATVFVNPNTGLLSVKLLRDDYDIATLRHITPDNATLSNFKRRSSGEIVNEMTVSFTNPITEKAESITAQDIASIESQDGQKVAGSRDYYGIRNRELAGKVLARDLRASTAPLISAEARLDRSGWDVLPGEVMLLSWPRRNANAVVVRAGKVSYGKPKDSAIRVSLMQDVFSLSKPAITIMPSTGWEDPTVDPQPLTMRLFTVPAFFARNAEMQGEVVALGPNEALVGALADSETYDSFDYELVSESVTANGDTVITSKGGKSMTPLALLASTMSAAASSVVPFALFPIAEETPRVGGFVFIGYGDSNQEVALVTGRTTTGWTIARGVLDSVPKTWAPGTPLWLVNPGARIVDTQTVYAEGSTAIYRGLDRTARGLLGYEDAPSISTVVTDRAHLPLRPANVRLNGVGFGSTPIGSATAVQVSWSIRNRLVEDSVVQLWTDSSIQPEYRQETVVSVYDATNDALLREYRWLWTETGVSFPRANLERYTALRFVVSARRDDSISLTSHAITVTGLAGDPFAPDLPVTLERTEPPSFYPAPVAGAFAMVAAILKGADGSHTPALDITGKQDRPEPTLLVVRHRPLFDPDPITGITAFVGWTLTNPYPLNQELVSFTVPGLLGNTRYTAECAYFVDGEIGNWRNLGQVITEPSVAGISDETLDQIVDDVLGQVDTNIGEGLQAGKDALVRGRKNALLILQNAKNALDGTLSEEKDREAQTGDLQDRLNIAFLIDPINKTGIVREDVVFEGTNETIVETSTRLIARSDNAVAGAVLTLQAYADDKVAQGVAGLATVSQVGEAISASEIVLKSYADDKVATATANLATVSQVGEAIGAASLDLQSYTDGKVSEATAGLASVSAVGEAVAAASLDLQSYTDGKVSEATANLASTSFVGTAISNASVDLYTYVDDKVSEGTASLVTTSALGEALTTAGISFESYADDAISEATSNLATISQVGSATAAAILEANTYADDVGNAVSSQLNAVSARGGGQTNIIKNPAAVQGVEFWSGGGVGAFQNDTVGTFFAATGTCVSTTYACSAGQVISLSLNSEVQGGGAYINYLPSNTIAQYVPFNTSGWTERKRSASAVAAPAGTTGFQVVIQGSGAAYWTRVMANLGPVPNDYRDDAAIPKLRADVAIAMDAAVDAKTMLETARLRLVAAAGGGNPAVVELYSDSDGASFVRLGAKQLGFGDNTVFDDATDTLVTTIGTVRYITAWGAPFGPDSLTYWVGPSTVATAGATKALAESVGGQWRDSTGDSLFGGKTLSGPFDTGAPSATPISLPKNTWTTIASVDRGMQTAGAMMGRMLFDTFLTGAAGGADDYTVEYRVVVTNPNGSNLVVIGGNFGSSTTTNAWTAMGGLAGVSFENFAVTLASRGIKKVALQVNPTGVNISTAQARNGRARGLYGA